MIFKINQAYQKAGLFLLGLFLIFSLLMYSNWIVNKLREDNRQIVKIYSEIIGAKVVYADEENFKISVDNILYCPPNFLP